MKRIISFAVVLCIASQINTSRCQESEPISYGASYVSDWGRNISGGIEQGNFYMGMIDLSLSLDFEQMNLWKGGEFYIQVENTHGATPTADLVGDIQTFSNIENGDGTYLYMLWYKQTLGNFSATIGVHDLNSEFVATEYGGTFINSSFGIQPSASLNVPTSIFPKPVLGVVLDYQINDYFLVRTGIYDGEPVSDPDDIYNLDFTISNTEGLLSISEAQYSHELSGKTGTYKLGVLYHTAEFNNMANGETTAGNYNIYAIIDQQINDNMGAFAQIGFADKEYNLNPFYLGGGINLTPTFFNREDDVLGLAFAYAKLSEHAGFDKDHETAIELCYDIAINDHIVFQPDLQYIINPGATSAVDNALIGFMRLKIEF